MSDKVIENCSFCRLANELNKEEIPFWSKKNENYSPYPKMVSCEEKYSLKNEDLNEITPKLNENSLEVKLKLGHENKHKWVFYWASNHSDDDLEINPPETAYGNYENHGLLKCNEKGKVLLKFNCPQPYKDDKQTYCRHIHYILEGEEKTWLPLKTIRVICDTKIEYLDERIKRKNCMIINALPEEYFNKEKIPNSVNLPTSDLEKLTEKSKERKIIKFLKLKVKDYPELYERVSNKTLDIRDIPIITYCAHSKCDASEKLIDFLYESKVNNVLEWKEGMEGWNKQRTFFKDDDEDVEVDEADEVDEVDEPDEVEEVDVETVKEADDDEIDEVKKDKDDDEVKEDKDDDEADSEDDDEDEEYEEIETGEEEEEEEEEEELLSIKYEGVEYSVQGDTLYDEWLEPIGKVKVENGEIIYMDDEVKKYHDANSNKEDVLKEPEVIQEETIDKELDEDIQEEVEEDKEVDDDDEDIEDKNDKVYSRHSLDLKSKGDLKDIVKGMAEREKDSYTYENLKDMNKKELVKLVSICQGKLYRKKTVTDYKFPTDKELNKMKDTELRELVNQMTGREPGTYKFTESSWSKPRLIDFIMTCQGVPKPRKKGGYLFVGGGWSL